MNIQKTDEIKLMLIIKLIFHYLVR